MLKIVFSDEPSGSDGGDTGTSYPLATKAEAEAGISNTSLMTPLRTKEAIDYSITNGAIGEAIDEALGEGFEGTMMEVTFNLQSDVGLVTIPATQNYIYCLGYAQRGDHPPTRYKRKELSPTIAPLNNLAWVKDASGVYFINDEARLDVRTMGAFATGQMMAATGTGNIILAGGNRVTLPGAGFQPTDVGKWMQVNGAGPLIENSSLVPPYTAHDGIFTDYLTAKIGTWINSDTVELVTWPLGEPLTASQTVTAEEKKLVYWANDNTDALKAACRAAATMKKFMYLPGNIYFYLSLKSICGINGFGNIKMEGDGDSTWIMHGTAQVPGDGSMIYLVGGAPLRTYLVPALPTDQYPLANTAGQDILKVESIDYTRIPIDSYMGVRDKSQPNFNVTAEEPYAFINGYKGEVIHIRELIGTQYIRCHSILGVNYNTNGPTDPTHRSELYNIQTQDDCCFRNMSLDMSKPITTSYTAVLGLTRTLRLVVENIYFRHSVYGVGLGASIDYNIRNCRFDWGGIVDGMQPDGDHDKVKAYSITMTGACTGGVLQNCQGRNNRHFVTGSAAGDIPPRHVVCDNLMVEESRGCIDSHPGADGWIISNCHVKGGIWTDEVDLFGGGFQIRGNDNDIINCSAENCSIGIQPVFIENTRIINFRAISCDVAYSLWNCRNIELIDCKAANIRNIGVFWHFTGSTVNQIQRFGYCRIKGFRLDGNPYQVALNAWYKTLIPCGMQFGYYDSLNNFVSQWEDGITIDDWLMPDCDVPFKGADHEAVYGHGILTNASAQNMRREAVAMTPITPLTSGVMFFSEIDLKLGRHISKIGTLFATAPVGQTNLWFGLFDKRLNLLCRSEDFGATAPSLVAMTYGTLDRLHKVKYEGRHYIGICQVAGTTSQIYGRMVTAAFAALPPMMAGNSTTGLTTPASWPKIASATSLTPMDCDLGPIGKKLITQSGKAFIEGMRVKVAHTLAPESNYILGRVTYYAVTTLWVEADQAFGTGTFSDWTITGDAIGTALTATGNIGFVAADDPDPVPAAPPTDWTSIKATADYVHLILHGQSNATGTGAGPVMTATPLTYARRFPGGVRPHDNSTDPAVIFGPGLVDYIETTGPLNQVETTMGGTVRMIKQLLLTENNIDISPAGTQKLLGSAPGEGGKTVVQLSVDPYLQRVKDHVNYGYARTMTDLVKSYGVNGICWNQGNSDYQADTSRVDYRTQLLALQATLKAHYLLATAKTNNIPLFITQTCSHFTYTRTMPKVALAQLDMQADQYCCVTTPDFIVGGMSPTGWRSDYIHYLGPGALLIGAYNGLAMKRWLWDGVKPQPLRPYKAVRYGNAVALKYTPVGALAFETAVLPNPGNYGFTMVDGSSANMPISTVEIFGNDVVIHTVAATAIPAGAAVRMGWITDPNLHGVCNLRDSQGDTIKFEPTGVNYALHRYQPIDEIILT